jgi:hypothetical protein
VASQPPSPPPCMCVCAGMWAQAFAAGAVFMRLAPATDSPVNWSPGLLHSPYALAVWHKVWWGRLPVLMSPLLCSACLLGGGSSCTSSGVGSSSPISPKPSFRPDLARLARLRSLPIALVLDGRACRWWLCHAARHDMPLYWRIRAMYATWLVHMVVMPH